MKTWAQLNGIAKRDNLILYRASGGVTVYTTLGMEMPLITITPGELTNEYADRVVRVALEAALRELKGLEQ